MLDFLLANTIIYLLIHFGVGGLIDNHLFYLRKNIFFVSFQLCASKPFSIIVSLLLYLILSSIAPNWTLIVHNLLFSIGFACKTNNASHNGNPFHICLFNCLEYYFFRYIWMRRREKNTLFHILCTLSHKRMCIDRTDFNSTFLLSLKRFHSVIVVLIFWLSKWNNWCFNFISFHFLHFSFLFIRLECYERMNIRLCVFIVRITGCCHLMHV